MEGYTFLSGSQANFSALVKRAGLLGSKRDGKNAASAPSEKGTAHVHGFRENKCVYIALWCILV